MGACVMFSDFGKAVAQFDDPRFFRVMLFGVALTLALLVGITALVLWLVEWGDPGSVEIPLVGPVGGLGTLMTWGAALIMLAFSVVLMVPVASAFTGLFLEDVCRAVEARHYPDLPPVPRPKFLDALIETANFIGLLIAVNLVCIGLYVVAIPLIPIIFWGANGLLLGREYFTLVASRRLGRPAAKALCKQHFWQVWRAGCLMAAPLSIPLLSLVIPVLGVATFTHLFQRLSSPGPRDLTGVPRSG